MNNIAQIQYTNNYKKFKYFEENRKLSPEHIHSLVSDPSFANKVQLSPVIIDGSFHVIDGQHRIAACEKLGIPVYYILDKDAKPEDIISRNANVSKWTMADYIKFHAMKKKPEYMKLQQWMETYKVNYSFMSPIITCCYGTNSKSINTLVKLGDMTIKEEYSNKIDEFLPIIFDFHKRYRSSKGYNLTRPVLTFQYTYIFFKMFLEDADKLVLALDKMCTSSKTPTFSSSTTNAYEEIIRVSCGRSGRRVVFDFAGE